MRARREKNPVAEPLQFVAYLLTFTCYGTHLRGAANGSADRPRKGRGGPIEPSAALVDYGKRVMTHAEASLNTGESLAVLDAIRQTCTCRNWKLIAAHIRRTHVHLVVDGIADVSGTMRDLKAYASRALNREGARRRWARGGNASRLPDPNAVRAAVRYVVDGQGPPMAVYLAPDFTR
jgi:REP element-mobilizing transposase RayT